jgi:ubiquinone/menaquinone biosynthesis C-methylase UbiE
VRTLDLGCGSGTPLTRWKLAPEDRITGVDVNMASLETARQKYPEHSFLYSAGEKLEFPEQTFDRVICALSLPYMKIPKALREIHRVLIPNGHLSLSLHPPNFTWCEFKKAFPRPKASL